MSINNKYYYNNWFFKKSLYGVIKKDIKGNLTFDKIRKEDCYFENEINNIIDINEYIKLLNNTKNYIFFNSNKIILNDKVSYIDIYYNHNLIKSVFTNYIHTYDFDKLLPINNIQKLNNYLFVKNNYYELNKNINKIILYDNNNNIIETIIYNQLINDNMETAIYNINNKINKLILLLNYALKPYGINIDLD